MLIEELDELSPATLYNINSALYIIMLHDYNDPMHAVKLLYL